MRTGSIIRLFQAGLVAACAQLMAVALATLLVFLAARSGLIAPTLAEICPNAEASPSSVSPMLTWVYLLTAIGIALTSGRFVDFTAAHIRRASRLMRPVEPDHATKALLVQLWLTAIGFAILVLRPPPHLWIEAGRYFGGACAASIAWSAVMSIGLACFGANAHAARKAF
ncbi:hypothetical protein CU102_26650 [Phyllobacterium brassicacearum]|uniref:DUF2975 domain-containing protein n=1 Tax=Phyllobacterium brassicacearum TaxID=314235 RepID=A0A2P7B5G3_9HYPH|nr:hypothetical protein [Phyllobacterium brassicacearum]PSH61696.1 hypothetical protein CU102_26650 [Phyllobacterium brassicacearum]TDQ14570.1 hypothetical protein DEV91_13813 [Phyllobacterium brassicacearum]